MKGAGKLSQRAEVKHARAAAAASSSSSRCGLLVGGSVGCGGIHLPVSCCHVFKHTVHIRLAKSSFPFASVDQLNYSLFPLLMFSLALRLPIIQSHTPSSK